MCGDDEIGGGSEECETCPDGTEPNEGETECVASGEYKVASCSRPLDSAPEGVGRYLPYHKNAVTESATGGRMERGFFALDFADALVKATMYPTLYVPYPPFVIPGLLLFTEGEVRKDANLGTCEYESNVSKERYDTVRTSGAGWRPMIGRTTI